MARPLNRRQARENAAFLRVLGETGNVELAARECGLHKPTLYSRRKVHAAFAAEWDAAMTAARARMAAAPGEAARAGKGRWPDSDKAAPRFRGSRAGGEPKVTRLADGTLQLRLARAGGMGFATEQAFLRALATCGNVAMAARAVGVAPRTISARRGRCPVFREEMNKARLVATDRLELALAARARAALCGDGADDVWLERELGPIPAMSADQAMMLLRLHKKAQALGDEWGRYALRRRRGGLSSEEIAIERRIWWELEQERREAQKMRRARAERRGEEYERSGNWFLPGEEVPDALREGRGKRRS